MNEMIIQRILQRIYEVCNTIECSYDEMKDDEILEYFHNLYDLLFDLTTEIEEMFGLLDNDFISDIDWSELQ